MRNRGVKESLIDRAEELYEQTKCRVRVNDELSEEFEVTRGLRQGNFIYLFYFRCGRNVSESTNERSGDRERKSMDAGVC